MSTPITRPPAGPDVTLHLKDLRRLDLKPGETLLVQLTEPNLTPEDANQMAEIMNHCFNEWYPGSHVLVLPLGMELSVVTPRSRWWKRRRTYAQIEVDRHMATMEVDRLTERRNQRRRGS